MVRPASTVGEGTTGGCYAPRMATRRPVDAGPRPFFTLAILYLFAFFFLFALALVAPALWEVAQSLPADLSEEAGRAAEQRAFEAARQAAAGRLLTAFLLAVATLVAGARFKVLPGLR